MATPYKFPWGLHPLDDWIKDEFNRRVNDYGMDPITSQQNMTGNYSGPRTAWARVFSNGISKLAMDREGFVMGGSEGFDESYGFLNDKVTIGVDASGKPHELEVYNPRILIKNEKNPDGGITNVSDFPHRPPPSVVSVETSFEGGQNSSFKGAIRKTTINWKCFSLAQLEYLTPYFLTPRITVLVEWGWNHYNDYSLVDLTDTEWLYGIFKGDEDKISDWIKASNGNYDLAMGFITNYDFKMNEFGGYDCTTTISNANYLLEGKAYQNQRAATGDKNTASGSIQLKDFTEFVFDDMDNLEIRNANAKDIEVSVQLPPSNFMAGAGGSGIRPTKKSVRDSSADIKKLNTRSKVFKDADDERWLRMDLVVDIINKFFSIGFLDKDGQPVDAGAGKFDITGVPMCAHPALKSTTKNIIIPNKFAPRFVSIDAKAATNSMEVKKQRLSDAQMIATPSNAGDSKQPTGEYYKLFPNILKVMTENKFDDTYDDIVAGLNSSYATARSFPQYKDYTDNEAKNSPKAGYWGYLSDIYINVNFFKSLVKKNDTVLKLIEELLQHISESMCNISQLKPTPARYDNTTFTAYDVNFTPVSTKKAAAELPRITMHSASSAFIKSADFSVTLSGDMANQMVMQSASGKPLPEGYGEANYDPKKMKISQFSAGDRMFDRGVIEPENVEKSKNDPATEQAKYKRQYSKENKSFYINKVKRDTLWEYYIMTETSSEFLKNILLDASDQKSIYANNAPMPQTILTLNLLGIGGITFLSQFTLDHVPSTYNFENTVWQISDVKQKIENKTWTTTITAQPRPLNSLDE